MQRCIHSEVGLMSGSDPGMHENAVASARVVARPASVDDSTGVDRWSQLRSEWGRRLTPGEQSALTAWLAFTSMFVGLRSLTHWIRDGHGPPGGGMSLGGQHFHHYNIGIALLVAVG